jgi:hypothetical protein
VKTLGTPYVEVTVVQDGHVGETILVNPDQVESVWPARPLADVPGKQPHATLHCATGETIRIEQTVAEFAARCADKDDEEWGVRPPAVEDR